MLPWLDGLWLDVEDSLALEAPRPEAAASAGGETLEVAVLRLRWMSNFTDVDALAAEPGVSVRFTRSPADVERADLVLVPGTKATVEDLERLRESGLAAALAAPRPRRRPDPRGLRRLRDARTSGSTTRSRAAAGARRRASACCRWRPPSRREKLAPPRRRARCRWPAARRARGYEIRHGHPARHGGEPLIDDGTAAGEGCVAGAVLGTSWHGLLEGDEVRRGLLALGGRRRGRTWVPGTAPFAAVRERHLDRLGDLIEEHADTAALLALIEGGAPAGLPVVGAGPLMAAAGEEA